MAEQSYSRIAAKLVSAIALGVSLSSALGAPAAAASPTATVSHRIAAIRTAISAAADAAGVATEGTPAAFDQVTHVKAYDKTSQPTKF